MSAKKAPTKRSKTISPWRKVAEAPPEYRRRGEQLTLFRRSLHGNENGQAAFRDPAFGENKNLPVHRWVPWIAGYSASFVDDVIAAYLSGRKRALVLDPFSGVGTTLLQAILQGHDTVGFEINPYPALAAKAKLSSLALDLSEFESSVNEMGRTAQHWKNVPPPIEAPLPFRSRIPFFSPRVEQQVLHAIYFINRIRKSQIADLFRTAFGAVMVSFSNYSYEPSLGSRPAAGKPLIDDADVAQILATKLRQMQTDMLWLRNEIGKRKLGDWKVVNADFFGANGQVTGNTVDLMVTSPPYMNNYHYVRNTRPQLYWLNYIASPSEQRHLETNNFGQYWQTVRDARPLELNFDHAGLSKTLKALRETRCEDGAYGGPGWANYVTAYFNDCYRFMEALKRLLVRGGAGVVVIGNSIIQGMNIQTEQLLGEIGKLSGLELEGVHCIREKRVGASITRSSVRYGRENKATLSESAVVLRKR